MSQIFNICSIILRGITIYSQLKLLKKKRKEKLLSTKNISQTSIQSSNLAVVSSEEAIIN
jgi:hypothetical protein